jgi:hypothetical protein
MNEKGKVTKAGVTARFMEIAKDPEYAEEVKVIKEVDKLMEAEAKAKKAPQGRRDLGYRRVEPLQAAHRGRGAGTGGERQVAGRPARCPYRRTGPHQPAPGTGRITELAERYASTLPELDRDVEALTAKVEAAPETHGAAMELSEAPVMEPVKRGFKKTEVGVIPKDWKVVAAR